MLILKTRKRRNSKILKPPLHNSPFLFYSKKGKKEIEKTQNLKIINIDYL